MSQNVFLNFDSSKSCHLWGYSQVFGGPFDQRTDICMRRGCLHDSGVPFASALVRSRANFTPARAHSLTHSLSFVFAYIIPSSRLLHWSELAPVWVAHAWLFLVASYKQMHSSEREPERIRAGAKVCKGIM